MEVHETEKPRFVDLCDTIPIFYLFIYFNFFSACGNNYIEELTLKTCHEMVTKAVLIKFKRQKSPHLWKFGDVTIHDCDLSLSPGPILSLI